jgi:hypothetical protein
MRQRAALMWEKSSRHNDKDGARKYHKSPCRPASAKERTSQLSPGHSVNNVLPRPQSAAAAVRASTQSSAIKPTPRVRKVTRLPTQATHAPRDGDAVSSNPLPSKPEPGPSHGAGPCALPAGEIISDCSLSLYASQTMPRPAKTTAAAFLHAAYAHSIWAHHTRDRWLQRCSIQSAGNPTVKRLDNIWRSFGYLV